MEGTITVLPKEPEVGLEGDDSKGNDGGRIRCPKCGWSPGSRDRWMCSCRHVWNTFDTGGVCPKCLKQWADTQCPRCKAWSPHSDWYPKG